VNEITAIETTPKTLTQAEAVTLQAGRADLNPALAYLRAMTPKARRVQSNALNTRIEYKRSVRDSNYPAPD
jgi:hypothetical protein